MPVDTLGWVHRPNVTTTLNTAERTVDLLTDERGFRVGETALQSEKNAFKILLLGDSFMEALQVQYEESLAGLLESELGSVIGRPVVVRNTAVGGWDPSQYLLQARKILKEEHFDLVLVSMFLGNDLVARMYERILPRVPAETHPFRWPRELSWGEVVNAWLYPINDMLEVRSHLFVLTKNQSQTLRMKLGLSASYFPSQFTIAEADSPQWVATAEICRDIAALAADKGTPTVFVLIPTVYQVDDKVFREYSKGFDIDPAQVDLEQPNRLLGQAMMALDLATLDALVPLKQSLDGSEPLYGRVDTHFSARGHRVVAEYIIPLLPQYMHQP